MAKKDEKPMIDKKNAEAPQGDKVEVKAKPRMKKYNEQDDTPIKVNLAQPKEEVKETATEKPVDDQPKQEDEKVVEEIQEKVEVEKVENKEEKTEQPVLEEITSETTDEKVKEEVEKVEEVVEETIEKTEKTGEKLPENIQKVVDFMNETGGDLEDYVKLNQDYDKYDDTAVLREYYRQTKPHLNSEEIDFVMEDTFVYEDDVDDPKDIKRKKLAFKEQVANARTHLDGLKSKYYSEIKAGVKLTPDQQKAINFFDRYNDERTKQDSIVKEQESVFNKKTNDVFNNKFKGFEYSVGEKKFRFNVKDVNNVKETQGDIGNFVNKFVDRKTQLISDANGYHKSLFTAMNADNVANHFYEQGKADAIKESIAKAKNVNMEHRQGLGEVEAGGLKVKVLQDDATNVNKFRFNVRK